MTETTESKWDPSFVDRIVYVLTNRNSGFTSGVFRDNLDFIPQEKPSGVWSSIQELLMLNREDTDHYLFIALSILHDNKEILAKIEDFTPSYKITNFPKESSSLENIAIVNHGNHNSVFLEYDKEFPIPKNYVVKALNDNSVNIETDTKILKNIFINVNSMYGSPPRPLGYSILSGDWNIAIPFEGFFRYEGGWVDGSIFKINYIPSRIDYDRWVEVIEGRIAYMSFLEDVGLFETYALSKKSTEKLAILCVALVKHYDKDKE